MANEPDLSQQGYMTFHELGRLVYVMRDWPGQLFSPVFASYSYAHPAHPVEVNPICRELIAKKRCPGAPGCELCIQDGVVDGSVDPFDISLLGLEQYFAHEGRWVMGQTWRLDEIVEGLLLHFYNGLHDALDDEHWRIPYLQQYRARAQQAGWPIVVNEYGFAVWPNEFGELSEFTNASIAQQVDDLRRFLQRHLGDTPEQQGPLLKLFWYQTGCKDSAKAYGMLCLFDEADELTAPVGRCWHDDATGSRQMQSVCEDGYVSTDKVQ